MGIGTAPKINTLNLSKGETFIQSIKLTDGASYPTGTSAQIVIKDDAEITLATWDGTVSGVYAKFDEDDVSTLDLIPHGSKYDLFINYPDGKVVKHSYGLLIRNQNHYPLVASSVSTNYSLQFSDVFDRDNVGKYWIPRSSGNAISIHNNGGWRTLGPNYSLFNSASAIWYSPLNSDSLTLTVQMVNVGSGKCTVAVCSDYSMTSWLGVQFETGISNNKLWIVKGTGPTTWTALTAGTSNTLTSGEVYTIKYNDQTRTIYCYKGTSLSPAVSWTDSSNTIPNGLGYRYTGLVWNTSLFAPGAEPAAWAARDGV